MKPRGTLTGLVLAAVFLAFLALYAGTAQQDANWQDSGVRQWRALTGDYAGVEGIALAHPLYIGLARGFLRLCPVGTPLFRLNLFSGVGMAAALVVLALLVQRLTGNLRAAVGAAILLGLAHMAWWQATLTQVYTWSLALFLLEVLLLQALLAAPSARRLAALALVSGMGLAVHDLALLSLPVDAAVAVLLFRRGRLSGRELGWSALAFAAGSAPFFALVVREALLQHSLAAAMSSALFGNIYAPQVLGIWTDMIPRYAMPNLCLFLLNFASPCWLLAGVGLWVARGRLAPSFRICLVVLTMAHALFLLRYFIADQSRFALPTLALLAIWAGVGLAWLLERVDRNRQWLRQAILLAGLAVAPAVYWTTWRALAMGHLAPPRARELPFRDEARYWILPWKHDEHSARRFAESVQEQLEPGALLFADGTAAGPLLATAAAASRPPQFQLISPYDLCAPDVVQLARADPARPFYVVSPTRGYVPEGLLDGSFAFSRTGVLYRVRLTDVRVRQQSALPK